MYVIGIDIPPGRYHCAETGQGQWIRYPGGSADPFVQRAPRGPAEVVILGGDIAFETDVPCDWECVEPTGPSRHLATRQGPLRATTVPAIVDPTLDRKVRRIIESHPHGINMRRPDLAHHKRVAKHAKVTWVHQSLATIVWALIAVIVVRETGDWWVAAIPFVVVVVAYLATWRGPKNFVRPERWAGEYPDRYLVSADFDEESRRLVLRTSAAIDAVMNAEVRRAGLLDEVEIAVTLPEERWQIAKALAAASRLRRERQQFTTDETPRADSTAEPTDAALASAMESLGSRVDALERYSERVLALDRAHRLHRHVTDRASEYQELVAAAAAGGDATRDAIARLTAQADDLDRRFRERVGAVPTETGRTAQQRDGHSRIVTA